MRFDINACFGHWQFWGLQHKSPEELLRLMDRFGIDKAAVMSLRGMQLDWREGNAETLAVVHRHADRLVACATISPFLGGDGNQCRRVLDAGFRMLRLYPSFHNYPLDSTFVDQVCVAAAAAGAPVMIPTRPMMNWRFKAIPIESIAAVAERHPDVKLVMSGPNYLVEYQALVKAMIRCPRMSYEISCLQGFEAVARLAAEVGYERLLFGTGAVLQYPACNLAKIDNTDLPVDQLTAIVGGNAARLLR